MADNVREELKAKRDRLAALKRENAATQAELAKKQDDEALERYSKALDVELGYEEWAASVLAGGDGTPPDSVAAAPLEPPNNASLTEQRLGDPLVPNVLGDDDPQEGDE